MPRRARSPRRKPATTAPSAARPRRAKTKPHRARTAAILDPILTLNSGGIIQSASDSVEQVFGWTPTELFGRNIKLLVPEPRRSALDRYLDRYRNADKVKTLTRTRRFDAVRKDGTAFQIELSMSRADLPVYAAPYFIGIVRDVSREIDVGTDPDGDRERLQRLITEQTRALATANLRLHLADRLASLGTLAAGLGHDMNSVLLPVRARLNALEHAGITAAAKGHVIAVRRSITYLQHLSDGLHFLALDPDGPGMADDGDGTTDLSRWWGQVGALLRKAVPRHVKIEASMPARLPAVKIAPHWLTQAVLNLIVNAGEALPVGRRKSLVRIGATTTENGGAIRLSVTDNGRGMAPGIQRRAFDLFFTTKSRSMGTGLGLPMARKVAVRAGGDVELRSEPGKGTTAVLVLPTVTRRSGTGGPRAATAKVRTAAVTLRDPRSAALITQVLIGAGMPVKPGEGNGPGKSDLWVTDPTLKALAAAARWRKLDGKGSKFVPGRSVVVLGEPPGSSRKKWAAIGATIIHPPDDFESIRLGLGRAIGGRPDEGTREAGA